MKNIVSFALTVISILGCVPVNQSTIGSDTHAKYASKKLRYGDYIYEPNIKTVQLHPAGSVLSPAVTKVRSQTLELTFDDLSEATDNYRVMIINCDYRWRPSQINSLEYLADYNEFDITDYEFSFDTQTPYVHYTFQVPPINRSGNYVMVVYRGDNPQDIILSRRIMIVDPQVEISSNTGAIGLANLSLTGQQINFSIRYPNYEIENPLANVNVSIRQNQYNGNQITGLKPSFIKEDLRELEFRFFDHESTFSATNEYRFFDLRSLVYPGQNVKIVNRKTVPPTVTLQTDKPKTGLAYAQYEDKNGQYVISSHSHVNGQYANVSFYLDCERIGYKGEAYLFGELTDWKITDEYKLKYDTASGLHHTDILLKQGHYEYQYLVKSDTIPVHYLEGSHTQSENKYEIFMYYKPYNERSDLLIGYYTTHRGLL